MARWRLRGCALVQSRIELHLIEVDHGMSTQRGLCVHVDRVEKRDAVEQSSQHKIVLEGRLLHNDAKTWCKFC